MLDKLEKLPPDPILGVTAAFRRDASQTAELPLVRNPLFYARGVGGTTLHYTANYWRFHEIDFEERSRYGAIVGMAPSRRVPTTSPVRSSASRTRSG